MRVCVWETERERDCVYVWVWDEIVFMWVYVCVSVVGGSVYCVCPSKKPDPIQTCLVMAIMSSMQPESDLLHLIHFHSSKGLDLIVQNRPGYNLDAWSGFGQTHLSQKQAGVQDSSGPATSIPLSDSDAFFCRRPGSYWAKPAQISFVNQKRSSGWLYQVFTELIRSGTSTVFTIVKHLGLISRWDAWQMFI